MNPGAKTEFTEHAVHGKYGLYSGSAGIGIFLLRLYAHYAGKKLMPLWEYGYLGKQE